jgi:type II secretory pathway component PulM
MIASFAALLARRSARERGLLAVFLWLVLPVVFVFMVLQPLLEQRAVARAGLAEAEATQRWYIARQVEIAALPVRGETPEAPRVAAVGLGGLEDRLIDAGLRNSVTLLANVQGDSVSLTLQDVPFDGLMLWAESIEAEAGYSVSALRLERGADGGLVSAELRLEPQT